MHEDTADRVTVIYIKYQSAVVVYRDGDKQIQCDYWARVAPGYIFNQSTDKFCITGHTLRFLSDDVINLEFVNQMTKTLNAKEQDHRTHRYMIIKDRERDERVIFTTGAIIGRLQDECQQVVIPVEIDDCEPLSGGFEAVASNVRSLVAKQLELAAGVAINASPLIDEMDDATAYIKRGYNIGHISERDYEVYN